MSCRVSWLIFASSWPREGALSPRPAPMKCKSRPAFAALAAVKEHCAENGGLVHVRRIDAWWPTYQPPSCEQVRNWNDDPTVSRDAAGGQSESSLTGAVGVEF